MKHCYFLLFFLAFASAKTSGQCNPDRHNTTWFDSWMSCDSSLNPNAIRGNSHWIMYDFGETYRLFQMKIWNMNAPDYLRNGMNDITIDISNDGLTWQEIGRFQVPMADGMSTYEGIDLYDFGGTSANYLLITGLSNHGGNCYGFSEIKIDVSEGIVTSLDHPPVATACLTASVHPNPVQSVSKVYITSTCSEIPVQFSIQDVSGKIVQQGQIPLFADRAEMDLPTATLVSGVYILSLQQGPVTQRMRIIKHE